MYTLEDDEETSSRLKKHDIASARSAPIRPSRLLPGSQAGRAETQLSGMGKGSPKVTVPLHTSQISSSFKKLTTPGRTSTGNQKVALAALTVACIAVFFTALDQTVVVTALPQIISDLQVPITQIDHAAWIISAYLLGFVVVMPLMGRVSDIYGRRRIFLLCLVIFGSGSIMCALAPLLGQLMDLGFLNIFGIDT